jgi:hypothetical protein
VIEAGVVALETVAVAATEAAAVTTLAAVAIVAVVALEAGPVLGVTFVSCQIQHAWAVVLEPWR